MQGASLLWQRNCSEDFKSKVSFWESTALFAEPITGFIAPRINSDGIDLSKRAKRDNKGKFKQQRAVRQKYVFVKSSNRGQRYRDYFNPNSAVQLRVMGMEDTVVRALPQPLNKLLSFI